MTIKKIFAYTLAAASVQAILAADGVWQGVTAQWSNPANWAEGIIPGDGGIVYLQSGTSTFSNDIAGLTLGGIVTSNIDTWTLSADSHSFAFPADPASTSRLEINAPYLHLRPPLGTGAGILVKEGIGPLALYTNALFSGRWLINTGRVEIVSAENLLAPPATLVPDALTLDGGAIKNNNSSPVFPPTMGIAIGPNGGSFCIGWGQDKSITYQNPITGPGTLSISLNSGCHILQNPANDWAGGTVVGIRGDGWYNANYAHLQLGADGVLPYGPDKGGLAVNGADKGLVDTAGHSNRVTSLSATPAAIVTNSLPGAGALYADALDFRGRLAAGARLVWCGPGAFNVAIPDGSGGGEIVPAADLALPGPVGLGGASLILDGVALTIPAADSAETLVATNSGTLLAGPSGASITLSEAGPASSPAIVLRSGLAETSDNTSHAPFTLNASLVIDGQAAFPARFDANLILPQDAAVTLRGSVWLARLPPAGQWSVAPGADIYPVGPAAADPAAFSGCTLHIVNDNLAAFASPVTVASGLVVAFDSRSLSADNATNTLSAAQDIALDGGTLGLTGAGAVTLSGAVSGSGAVVKTGSGTASLSGANSFSGSVTVSNGTLAAASSAAFGSASITLAGGRLANTPGADITLAQPVDVLGGGFTVTGGSIRLSGGLVLPDGALDKQGDGELIIDGAAFTSPDILTLTGGAVVLDVPAGTTNTVPSLRGAGDLIKRGGGTLIVNPHATYAGRIVLEAGIITQPVLPPPAEDPAFWLDAAAADTFTFSNGNAIVRWNDRRDAASGTARPYAFLNAFVPKSTGADYKTAYPPTLLPDALAGRPAVDFGAGKSGQWLEFTEVPDARIFFIVIGSQNGGGQLIGSPDQGTARQSGSADNVQLASDGLWNSSTWNGTSFRTSLNWLDGVSVPISAPLSGGWDLLTTQLPSATRLNGLAHEMRPIANTDGTARSGGQRIAELLVYTRVLTADERAATEAYLRAKWFSGEAVSTWNSGLTVAGGGTLDLPSEQNTLRIASLTGSADLAKTGAGTLTVENPGTFAGTLALAEGTFTADGPLAALTKYASPTNPAPGAAFWVDAAVPGSFGKDASDRAFWRDARWQQPGDWLSATQRWAYAPSILSNAVGVLPVIDFGPTNVQGGMQWTHPVSNITAVFWLIGSQNGGGTLLGGDDNNGHFNRYHDNAPASAPIYSSFTAANAINGLTRIDGVQIDGTATGLNGGYQVISLRTAGTGVFAGQFAHDREITATAKRHGGQRLGECIIYTNALSDADIVAVEAYLLNKWQRPATRDMPAVLHSLDIPGDARSEAQVPSPATVHVDSRTLTVSGLSGGGPVRKTGDATLNVVRYGGFAGELTVTAGTAAFAKAHRYVRLTVSAIRGPSTENPPRASLCEFELLKDGVKVPWPAGTVATGSEWLTQNSGYGPDRLIDGLSNANGRWISVGLPAWAMFDLLAPTEFDAYRIITGSETTYHYRDPITWVLEASGDGNTWQLLDTKSAQAYASQNNFTLGPYAVDGNGDGDGKPSAMTLTLQPGASAVFAPGSHTLGAIGGIGAILGGDIDVSGLNLTSSDNPADALALAAPLTVEAAASWTVTVASGEIAPLVSSSGITFAGGGTLFIAGASNLTKGDHLLAKSVEGAALTGFEPSAWTVGTDDSARQFSAVPAENAVYLRVSTRGLLILIQ